MGRPPRVLVEGGVYHVYNRVARGEPVFRDEVEAGRLVLAIRQMMKQDGLSVLAWCVMSNHYHLVVRMGSVPLSRTMQAVQQRFTRSFNGRHKLYGPFWQGRFKSKLVQDPRYLWQLITYVHNNPAAAGVVGDLAEYEWSGHREVLRRSGLSLLDVDEMLLVFGESRRAAKRAYLTALETAREAEWSNELPGRLPWWKLGRPRRGEDDELEIDLERPRVDAQGLSTAVERPLLELPTLLELGAQAAGLGVERLGTKTRDEETIGSRQAVLLVLVERYGAKVGEIAEELGKSRETVSRWLGAASRRRAGDRAFGRALDDLDRRLATLGWRNVT
jgi:REP element-mobilizing transposase RayT